MRNPKPFVVIQNGKLIFTVYAYSLEQARAIVAAKVAGETIVVGVATHGTSPMIPDTKNGLPAMVCVSAMQKAIRRGLEREAMEFGVELLHTSQSLPHHGLQPAEVICHEDLDTLAAPHVVPFVAAAVAQSQERYAARSIGEARLMVGNASGSCAARQSPAPAAISLPPSGCGLMLEDYVPTVPDFALDQHTLEGRKLGRGLDHFRQEGAKLVPPPTGR